MKVSDSVLELSRRVVDSALRDELADVAAGVDRLERENAALLVMLRAAEEAETGDPEIALPESARELWNDLERRKVPGIVSVGARTQSGEILVYTLRNPRGRSDIPAKWGGYPVLCIKSGQVLPATGKR